MKLIKPTRKQARDSIKKTVKLVN